MTLDEAIKHAEEIMAENLEKTKDRKAGDPVVIICFECAEEHRQLAEWLKDYQRLLEWQSCEMTAEKYRQRMMQAFHNADCGELIAVCVQPIEKEFEHLEWLLKDHYKKEPCEDAISRENTLKAMIEQLGIKNEDYLIPAEATLYRVVKNMPPVQPQLKMGRWIESTGRDDIGLFYTCSECGRYINLICGAKLADYPYCHCGAKMEVVEE